MFLKSLPVIPIGLAASNSRKQSSVVPAGKSPRLCRPAQVSARPQPPTTLFSSFLPQPCPPSSACPAPRVASRRSRARAAATRWPCSAPRAALARCAPGLLRFAAAPAAATCAGRQSFPPQSSFDPDPPRLPPPQPLSLLLKLNPMVMALGRAGLGSVYHGHDYNATVRWSRWSAHTPTRCLAGPGACAGASCAPLRQRTLGPKAGF